jgi:Rrf2 family protein
MGQTGSTMQLTRAADYAVRVMIHLATVPVGERSLLPDLAKATGAPASFLSKVLQELCRSGLIASRRGQSGGFEILDTGRKASMRQVIEAIDGPIYLNLCLMSGASCSRKTYCPAHPFWTKAQEAMLAVLDTAMVADLSAQAAASAPSGAPAGSERKAASKAKPARSSRSAANPKLAPAR